MLRHALGLLLLAVSLHTIGQALRASPLVIGYGHGRRITIDSPRWYHRGLWFYLGLVFLAGSQNPPFGGKQTAQGCGIARSGTRPWLAAGGGCQSPRGSLCKLQGQLSADRETSNSVQSEKVSDLMKRAHFSVEIVRSTGPPASRRTVCVRPFTATAGLVCAVAVTPSFTCTQSMRRVPLSLNTSP